MKTNRKGNHVVLSADLPAVVLFKELPEDKILITGFENFLTGEEIANKYGENIRKQYFKYGTMILKKIFMDGFSGLLIHDQPYKIDDVLDKKEFNVLIGSLNYAGKLLHDLVKANKTKAKSITI